MALHDDVVRILGLLLGRVCQLHVEEVQNKWNRVLDTCLRESLAQTDTVTAEEGLESKWMSWLAVWRFEVWRSVVKALGDEALGLYPKTWVVLDCFNDYNEWMTCFDFNLLGSIVSKSHILTESLERREVYRRLLPNRLVEALLYIVEFVQVFKLKQLFKSFLTILAFQVRDASKDRVDLTSDLL